MWIDSSGAKTFCIPGSYPLANASIVVAFSFQWPFNNKHLPGMGLEVSHSSKQTNRQHWALHTSHAFQVDHMWTEPRKVRPSSLDKITENREACQLCSWNRTSRANRSSPAGLPNFLHRHPGGALRYYPGLPTWNRTCTSQLHLSPRSNISLWDRVQWG